MVPAQGMGPKIEQAGWSKEGQDRSRSEAGHYSALYLDCRYGRLVMNPAGYAMQEELERSWVCSSIARSAIAPAQ